MKITRKCKTCGDDFSAIKATQFFCSRKCFKKDYYIRTKANIENTENNPHFPIKKCDFCEERSQLTFDPMKNRERYSAWRCPHCGVTNKLIWEYANNINSYSIISKIIISIKLEPVVIEQPKEVTIYRLPVQRPGYSIGMNNNNIVVMTCDNLDIFEFQKKERKRITFS